MTEISLSDYDYTLPKSLIAVKPLQDRPSCRLLHLDRKTQKIQHRTFRDIQNHFVPGDVLVLNDTKVFSARLFGKKDTGGKVEVFLLRRLSDKEWEVLLRPGGRLKKKTKLLLGEGDIRLEAEVLDDAASGGAIRRISFSRTVSWEEFQEFGHMPLPPYMERPDGEDDLIYYQTVYAREYGAVAAPTAGLHFDDELLQKLKNAGVHIVHVTLHVGYGTFRPVINENLSEHKMEEEFFEISEQAAGQINLALEEKRRVIACGTTVVRCLESSAGPDGRVLSAKSSTHLFVYPPYDFKIVSGLITNFHLPKSTLLMLVSAFAGYELMVQAYEEAIKMRYYFYSYGDAMLIL